MESQIKGIIGKPYNENESLLFIRCIRCNEILTRKIELIISINKCRECENKFSYLYREKKWCRCIYYNENNYLIITCNNCLLIKTKNEEEERKREGEQRNEEIDRIEQEQRKQKKLNFKKKWNGSIRDKLECYGKKKLLILATNKKLKGRWSLDKKKLIDALEPITTIKDFPIK